MRIGAEEFRRGDWPQKDFDGRWLMCRPVNVDGVFDRLRDAWAVLTGKADALFWEAQ